jgi:hypothetical protein
MKIEILNVSKFHTPGRVGDDVPVVLPGVLYGVFDGATDPRGTMVGDIGAGRLAALAVAAAASQLAMTPANRRLAGTEIIAHLSAALADATAPLNLPIPPSTTVAMALDCDDHWRFLALGDTGIRLNGTELVRHEKLIDAVSTTARVAVFRLLAGSTPATDATERAARRSILMGFDTAVTEGVLDACDAGRIIRETTSALGLADHGDLVAAFLSGGIKTQYRLSNDPDGPLGFDTLNGTLPRRGELVEFSRPKTEVRSIEIFSDGYPSIPPEVSAAAWESAFHQAEHEDPHKIGRFATVKGSTRDEVFDDRTVVVLSGL